MQERQNIAVFVDYDNIEIGVRARSAASLLFPFASMPLKNGAKSPAKFAYANWSRQEGAVRQMAENAVQMGAMKPLSARR